MKKYALLLLILVLVSCSTKIDKKIEIPQSSDSKNKIYEEVKNIEEDILEEKEHLKKKIEDKKVAKQNKKPETNNGEIKSIEIRVEEKKIDKNFSYKVKEVGDAFSKPLAKTKDESLNSLEYIGVKKLDEDLEVEEAKRNYSLKVAAIDKEGDKFLFIPKVQGGKFRIQKVDYREESQDYIVKENIINKDLMQDDAVLLLSNIGETSSRLLLSYEKKGEFYMESFLIYNGMDGGYQLTNGFKLED